MKLSEEDKGLNKLIQRAKKLGVEVPLFKEHAIIRMEIQRDLMADLIVGFGMSKNNPQYKEVKRKYEIYRDFASYYGFNVFACQYHESPSRRRN